MRSVLVFFDTLRRDALEPYARDGHTAFEGLATPNFNRLAARSCTYDKHYVGSMPCMPARRELHTGRYNFMFRSWGPLEPFDFSMPRALQSAGVHSHLISDHYHYWEGGGATYHTRYSTWENIRGQEGDSWIAAPGFDDFPDTLGCPHRFMTDQDQINRQWMLANGHHPQRKTFDQGLAFLDRNKNADDWFLQIETFDPHEPFFTDEGTSDQTLNEYDGPRFDWPAYGDVTEKPEHVDHARRRYAELIRMCDRQLGRVLDAFDRHGLWDDTALIVTTDHGFLLGEHDQWGKMVQPMFQEVAHIPLFAWVPPAAERHGLTASVPGSRCEQLTQTIDLAPSILALHGVKPQMPDGTGARMDGGPIWESRPERDGLFGLFGGHVAVTDGHHVFMRAPDKEKPLLEHTLMPWNMREPAAAADLRRAALVTLDGFAEEQPVLCYPGRMHSPKLFPWLHDLLFNVADDPSQSTNLLAADGTTDALNEWKTRLHHALERSAAPPSVFDRLRI